MVKSTYDREKCVNEVYDEKTQSYITIDAYNEALPKEKQIAKT
jgi:hypothetical protein